MLWIFPISCMGFRSLLGEFFFFAQEYSWCELSCSKIIVLLLSKDVNLILCIVLLIIGTTIFRVTLPTATDAADETCPLKILQGFLSGT